MQFDAPFGQLDRKRRGMWTFLFAALNRFVRYKPCVAATTQIASARMPPARDVAFVLIWHAQSESIQLDTPGFGEMKNVFVSIVKKSLRIYRFEMTEGANCCSRFPVESAAPMRLLGACRVARRATATTIVDRDRFDPVDRVLQLEGTAQHHHDFMWQQRVRWRGTDVEKK